MSGVFDDFFTHLAARDRLPWPAGEPHVHVHALPPAHLAETLAHTYAALGGLHPDLALVPPAWMHLTVLHGPPTAQTTSDQLAAIEEKLTARLAGCAPIEVTLRPGICWGRFGVVSQAARTSQLDPLWEAARDVIAAVTGSQEYLPRVYAPHLSLVYTTGPAPIAPVRRWLGDRDLPTLTWEINSMHLLSQSHDHRTITWTGARRIPLGATGHRPPAPPQPAEHHGTHHGTHDGTEVNEGARCAGDWEVAG